MKKTVRIITPIAIFAVLGALALLIRANPPESNRRPPSGERVMMVQAAVVEAQDYRVQLQSYGTVQPRTRSMLTAQVSGQIVYVNPNVRDGGFFGEGDVLVEIDARDYEANLRIAEAVLMDARQMLADAQARSELAREDWEMLGNEGEPPALVLQLPKLEAAKARVISAEATLEKAKLDLERTRIVAPFAGRVLRKNADIGQVVSANSPIAEIYATDYVEIRLPIRNRDLAFIELPETYRDRSMAPPEIEVSIISDLGGRTAWNARLVRTEGAIDESARQLHVIAQIDDPFGRLSSDQPQLKIGQYVTAELEGRMLDSAVVIPNAAIYQGSYVYVAEEGLLQRRDVEIAWQNDRDAIIRTGLSQGELLVTTPLGQVTSGVRVMTEPASSRLTGKDDARGGDAANGGRP